MAALKHLRSNGASDIFNCGYSKGFSVPRGHRDRQADSGVDFEVRKSPRRAGDPAATVAGPEKICATLGWKPQYHDTDGTVASALAWGRRLATLRP